MPSAFTDYSDTIERSFGISAEAPFVINFCLERTDRNDLSGAGTGERK
jgi:hypothetical protein